MAKLYYDLINKGLRTIDDVPVTWKSKTQTLLDADVTV
ncbi:CD1375 family protein [Paenibacillus glacialis]|nr:CD1375 family protein [Paenibacillus glacialis]